MRSKNILSIVAFVTAFVVSVAFASLFISKPTNTEAYALSSTSGSTANYKSYCNLRKNKSRTALTISTFIANDEANITVRSRQTYNLNESYPPSFNSVTFADFAEDVEDYVNDSSSMSTDGLPTDFKSAWRSHMKAWRDYSNFLNKSANISRRNDLTEEEFNEAKSLYDAEIASTWSQVLKVGASYGADVR